MTIKVDENIRAIVYCQFSRKMDFMCGVSEVPDTGGKVKVIGRVRAYDGDQTKDPFEDGDTKRWLESKEHRAFDDELARILTMLSQLVAVSKLCGMQSNDNKVYVIRRGEKQSLESFMEDFGKMPFAHMKKLSVQ